MKYLSDVTLAFATRTLPTALKVLENLDTPVSLSVYLLAKDGSSDSWDQIFDKTVSPGDYLAEDHDLFARDYCASKLLSKAPNFLKRDLRAKAIEAFSEAEYHCYWKNQQFLDGSVDFLLRDRCLPTLSTIKKQVSFVLGRAPSMQTVVNNGGWGPGSSYALSRREASPELKCEYENTVTYRLLNSLCGVELPSWFSSFRLVPGNLVTTVPKNGKTDRTIAIEPGVNSFIQKGIGSCIRSKLRRRGINLNDQGFNQNAALVALRDGYCTIDLKAASDSISLLLCERVLPTDWLKLITVSRSERGTLSSRRDKDKVWFEYQKISSMGNGFTFELESALFFSVLLACGVDASQAYVYGDDLIFPVEYAACVCETLKILGFETNFEKSFVSGIFYESCGVHVFNGIDVTPIQIKDCFHGPKDVIVFANKLRLFSHDRNYRCGCARRYLPSYRMCVSWLPAEIRKSCRGPVGSGLTLYSNLNESCSVYNRKRGRFQTSQLVPVIKTEMADFSSLLQYRLFQMENILQSNLHEADAWTEILAMSRGNTVKQHLSRFKRSRLFVEQWHTLGDWI